MAEKVAQGKAGEVIERHISNKAQRADRAGFPGSGSKERTYYERTYKEPGT